MGKLADEEGRRWISWPIEKDEGIQSQYAMHR